MTTPDRRPAKSYDEMRPGHFLKASLFAGKPRTLTITAVNIERMESDKGVEDEGVVSFAETEREWVLNSTNKKCMIAMWGSDPAAAVGHKITLYPTRTKFGAEDVDAIRVWGSPELKSDLVVEIKLPKKKATRVTLHAVTKPPPPEPGSNG